jgi:hypothetical protein
MQPRSIFEGIQIAALGALAGTLCIAGLTAAIAFPAMKRLDPALPGIPVLRSEHWSLAAGYLAHPVLSVAIWAQVSLAAIALAAAILGAGNRGWTRVGTRTCVIAVLFLGVMQAALLLNTMNPALESYREAAAAGDTVNAKKSKAAFDAVHPAATRYMTASLVCAVVGVGFAILDGRRARRGETVGEP